MRTLGRFVIAAAAVAGIMLACGPGSATDIMSRLIAANISETWGQPIVFENRAGADGYTLLGTSAEFPITAALRTDLSYASTKEFAGVSEIGYGTGVIVVSPSLGVKSVAELALPDVKDRLNKLGFQPTPTTPPEHEKNMRADIEAFTKIGRQIGLRSK